MEHDWAYKLSELSVAEFSFQKGVEFPAKCAIANGLPVAAICNGELLNFAERRTDVGGASRRIEMTPRCPLSLIPILL